MKAIVLVDDMPDSCFNCKYDRYDHLCGIELKNNDGNANKRPSWCPLKPLPQKKGKYGELHEYDTDIHYEIGWNACLDEITDHIDESTEKVCNDDLYESWMFFDEGETE